MCHPAVQVAWRRRQAPGPGKVSCLFEGAAGVHKHKEHARAALVDTEARDVDCRRRADAQGRDVGNRAFVRGARRYISLVAIIHARRYGAQAGCWRRRGAQVLDGDGRAEGLAARRHGQRERDVGDRQVGGGGCVPREVRGVWVARAFSLIGVYMW